MEGVSAMPVICGPAIITNGGVKDLPNKATPWRVAAPRRGWRYGA